MKYRTPVRATKSVGDINEGDTGVITAAWERAMPLVLWDKDGASRPFRKTHLEIVPDHIVLKWGSLKRWADVRSDAGKALVARYLEERERDDKQAWQATLIELCANVAAMGGTIYLDWYGKFVTVAEAKTYILEYETTYA